MNRIPYLFFDPYIEHVGWGWRVVGLCSPCSVVLGMSVAAAVRRKRLCPRCPGAGRCLSGVNSALLL